MAPPKHQAFVRMPPSLRTLARGLLRRRPGLSGAMPSLDASAVGVVTDAPRLAAYRSVCGLADASAMPILWPQLLAGPLHVAVLAHPCFPWSALGIVHVGQRVTRHRALPDDAALDLSVHTTEAVPARRGAQFGLVTQAHIGGECVWHSTMHILVPGAEVHGEPAARRTVVPLSRPREEQVVAVPEDIGRRYRRVSGDVNPIHLHRWTARPFGFERAIAHGTWTLARALGTGPVADAIAVQARFCKPVFLPSTTRVIRDDEGRVQVTSEDRSTVLVDVVLKDRA